MSEWGSPTGMPSGTIVMWSGSESNIPSGWTLCDGTDGTPDLRDRFVAGAGSGQYAPGDTGGSDSVQLSRGEMPTHSHGIEATGTYGGGGQYISTTYNEDSTADKGTKNEGSGQAHENRPPYHALCMIQKT